MAASLSCTRRDFLKQTGAIALAAAPSLASIGRRRAEHITILHTADIHAQLDIHDEFFIEDGRPRFKRRGGFATLRRMIETLRRQNPRRTLLVDSGDCLQGSAVAARSHGRAIVPLVNEIRYDVMLPGNWEVVYGKDMLVEHMSRYTAAKACANMFHADAPGNVPMFPPVQVFTPGRTRVGFIGYNDPGTPTRQPPANSRGIRFGLPEDDLAAHVRMLRDEKGCDVVFVLSHLGLAQQLSLANQPCAKGVAYILGGDTHERVREPIACAFTKVTEPGAFGSFVGKLDLIVEAGAVKEEKYELLDVDPERYGEDPRMKRLVAAAREPFRQEIGTVVGTTRTPLLRYYVIETPLDNLITDALMWKFKTDFVVSNGFRFCPPLVPPPGGEAVITREYLWSMLPDGSALKEGVVTGRGIREWLEIELENAFARDAAQRFGGWFVRFKGLFVKFTIGNAAGSRVLEVRVQGEPLDPSRRYTVVGCTREGDADDTICRLVDVANPRRLDPSAQQVLIDYLAVHSPVSPTVEGRAVATDAPADLLSQVDGTTYRFR